jgi:hypothetical protein
MTQLCVLPGCRLRGRHLPTCADDGCPGCLPRATDEGIACQACTDRAARHLAEIIEFTPDARAVAHGEVRRGQGGGSGKPGSRPPLNVDAVDALDAIQNALTTMAREIADERGLTFGTNGRSGRLRSPLTAQNGELVHLDTRESETTP